MSYKDPLIFFSSEEDEPTKVLFSDFKELEKENKRIKDALVELVALKDMKDAGVVKQNYIKRKPRAWEVARQVVKDT